MRAARDDYYRQMRASDHIDAHCALKRSLSRRQSVPIPPTAEASLQAWSSGTQPFDPKAPPVVAQSLPYNTPTPWPTNSASMNMFSGSRMPLEDQTRLREQHENMMRRQRAVQRLHELREALGVPNGKDPLVFLAQQESTVRAAIAAAEGKWRQCLLDRSPVLFVKQLNVPGPVQRKGQSSCSPTLALRSSVASSRFREAEMQAEAARTGVQCYLHERLLAVIDNEALYRRQIAESASQCLATEWQRACIKRAAIQDREQCIRDACFGARWTQRVARLLELEALSRRALDTAEVSSRRWMQSHVGYGDFETLTTDNQTFSLLSISDIHTREEVSRNSLLSAEGHFRSTISHAMTAFTTQMIGLAERFESSIGSLDAAVRRLVVTEATHRGNIVYAYERWAQNFNQQLHCVNQRHVCLLNEYVAAMTSRQQLITTQLGQCLEDEACGRRFLTDASNRWYEKLRLSSAAERSVLEKTRAAAYAYLAAQQAAFEESARSLAHFEAAERGQIWVAEAQWRPWIYIEESRLRAHLPAKEEERQRRVAEYCRLAWAPFLALEEEERRLREELMSHQRAWLAQLKRARSAVTIQRSREHEEALAGLQPSEAEQRDTINAAEGCARRVILFLAHQAVRARALNPLLSLEKAVHERENRARSRQTGLLSPSDLRQSASEHTDPQSTGCQQHSPVVAPKNVAATPFIIASVPITPSSFLQSAQQRAAPSLSTHAGPLGMPVATSSMFVHGPPPEIVDLMPPVSKGKMHSTSSKRTHKTTPSMRSRSDF